MTDENVFHDLVAILQLAYSGELAACYAYRSHWHSLHGENSARIREIETEEWHHRYLVGGMLESLGARPSVSREIRARVIGRTLGFLRRLTGWLAPMYGAGKLESRNIVEYETAARYARACGREDFVNCLLTMAEVEWEHEKYFRSCVLRHRLGRRLPLWPQPPPKETIRPCFEQNSPTLPLAEVALLKV